MNRFLISSVDPNKVSLAVKGFLGLFASIALFFGVASVDFNEGVELAGQLAFFLTSAVSAFMGLYGLYRKWSAGRWSAPDPNDIDGD